MWPGFSGRDASTSNRVSPSLRLELVEAANGIRWARKNGTAYVFLGAARCRFANDREWHAVATFHCLKSKWSQSRSGGRCPCAPCPIALGRVVAGKSKNDPI